MANIKSQMKRIKTNEKARLRNKVQKSSLRTAIKKFETEIAEGNKEAAKLLPNMYKKIDSAVSKGILHKNKANRLKSKYAKNINEL